MSRPCRNSATDYIPALDGLRAIAVLLVVLSHAGWEHLIPGSLGVTIFFVISGYLITRQLIEELLDTHDICLRGFYLRRALRLMPALLLYIVTICGALIAMGASISLPQIASGLFYYANYYHVFVGYTAHNPMPILWSLSVEEHFYILFPFAFLLFRKKPERILPWLIAACIAALVWRIILFTTCGDWFACGLPTKERYFGTDTIFDCILFGCLAAMAQKFWNDKIQRYILSEQIFYTAILIMIGTVLCRDDLFRHTIRFSLQAASAAVIILNLAEKTVPEYVQRILAQPHARIIGQASYSIYLFHYGALAITNKLAEHEGTGLTSPGYLALYFILTIIMSAISYICVEKPVMRLRHRFGSMAAH